MTAKSLLQSAGDGSAIPAGVIGEIISDTQGVSCNTTTGAAVAVVTLTAGRWLVSGSVQAGATAGSTYIDTYLNVKGVETALLGTTRLYQAFPTGQAGCVSFIPNVVVIAPGDANKQVFIRGVSGGATMTLTGFITAIRLA